VHHATKTKKNAHNVNGTLSKGVGPKDVALYIISQLSTSGERILLNMGNVFEEMSMEGRMTVCNLSIEMGARGGMIAPDRKHLISLKVDYTHQKEKNGQKQWLIGKH
jgi:3-isopropylmalate/(R)-2-methylmalate dehydratase large subunit